MFIWSQISYIHLCYDIYLDVDKFRVRLNENNITDLGAKFQVQFSFKSLLFFRVNHSSYDLSSYLLTFNLGHAYLR